MEPTLSSETSAFKLQTPGKFPKEHRQLINNSSQLNYFGKLFYPSSGALDCVLQFVV